MSNETKPLAVALRRKLDEAAERAYDIIDAADDGVPLRCLADEVRKVLAGLASGGKGAGEAAGPSRDFIEGRNGAIAAAAMVASDMGHPDVRHRINQLIPDGDPFRPIDTPQGASPVPASPDESATLRCEACGGSGNDMSRPYLQEAIPCPECRPLNPTGEP